MEDAADRPAEVETAAGEKRSREKHLSRASSSDSDEMYSGVPPEGGKAIGPSGEGDVFVIPQAHMMDKTLILDRNNNLPPPSAVTLGGDPQELYLQALYTLPNSHNFYCPNCKSCVTKVIILRDAPSSSSPLLLPSQPPSYQPFRELPPPSSAVGDQREAENDYTNSGQQGGRGRIVCSNCFSFLLPIGSWITSQLGFGRKKISTDPAEIAGTTATTSENTSTSKSHAGSSSSIFHGSEIEGGGSISVTIPTSGDETAGGKVSGGRRLEIIKSIVYGGLTESITSLGIVTSAASASTPTENIVALALANLITGLIVIVNNLSGLKSNQVKKEAKEREEVEVDPYEEALGDRHHYVLHFTMAILSFLLFGLLPPLVYGFSFRDTGDGDLKLAAVAVTSLVCIALLGVAKAYIQKPHKWEEFVKTVVYYIALGFGASGLSYLAGKELGILLEQLDWFSRDPMAPTLLLPSMDFAKPTWGSL